MANEVTTAQVTGKILFRRILTSAQQAAGQPLIEVGVRVTLDLTGSTVNYCGTSVNQQSGSEASCGLPLDNLFTTGATGDTFIDADQPVYETGGFKLMCVTAAVSGTAVPIVGKSLVAASKALIACFRDHAPGITINGVTNTSGLKSSKALCLFSIVEAAASAQIPITQVANGLALSGATGFNDNTATAVTCDLILQGRLRPTIAVTAI